jgi:hypothetical protein
MISAAENSNKFQKTRFWKEKSVEDMVTLEPKAQAHTSAIETNKVTHLKNMRTNHTTENFE